MKNNKIDVGAMIEMTKIYITDDQETLKLATEIINECADVTGEKRFVISFLRALWRHIQDIHLFSHLLTDEDRCEAIYKFIVCTEDGATSRGIIPSDKIK